MRPNRLWYYLYMVNLFGCDFLDLLAGHVVNLETLSWDKTHIMCASFLSPLAHGLSPQLPLWCSMLCLGILFWHSRSSIFGSPTPTNPDQLSTQYSLHINMMSQATLINFNISFATLMPSAGSINHSVVLGYFATSSSHRQITEGDTTNTIVLIPNVVLERHD